MAEYHLRRRVFRRDFPRHDVTHTATLQDVATIAFLADASIEVVAMEERAPGDWVVFVPNYPVGTTRPGCCGGNDRPASAGGAGVSWPGCRP